MILTSMLKNVGDSFAAFFEDVENGEEVWGKLNRLGLKENPLAMWTMNSSSRTFPRRSVTRWLESQEKILSGEITVKSYYDFANEAEYQQLLDSVAP